MILHKLQTSDLAANQDFEWHNPRFRLFQLDKLPVAHLTTSVDELLAETVYQCPKRVEGIKMKPRCTVMYFPKILKIISEKNHHNTFVRKASSLCTLHRIVESEIFCSKILHLSILSLITKRSCNDFLSATSASNSS